MKILNVKYHINWYRHFLSLIYASAFFLLDLTFLFIFCILRATLTYALILKLVNIDIQTSDLLWTATLIVGGANRGVSQLLRILTLDYFTYLILAWMRSSIKSGTTVWPQYAMLKIMGFKKQKENTTLKKQLNVIQWHYHTPTNRRWLILRNKFYMD